jgi:hypothetical protein
LKQQDNTLQAVLGERAVNAGEHGPAKAEIFTFQRIERRTVGPVLIGQNQFSRSLDLGQGRSPLHLFETVDVCPDRGDQQQREKHDEVSDQKKDTHGLSFYLADILLHA